MTQVVLAIETSTPVGSVAVGVDDTVLAEVILGAGSRHSEHLLPAIEYGLRIAGLRQTELGCVVIGAGPGSFTGLRIAAATAKGLAAALNLEVFGYSGLLALAASNGVRDRPVCALFDARRDEVYAACYGIGDKVEIVLSPRVEPLANVLEALDALDVVYAGEGAHKHAALIEQHGGAVLPPHLGIPRASALLWLANTFPDDGRIEDPRHWEPDYLRESGAERGRPQ